MKFTGSYVALATPFDDTGAVDERAYQDFVAWQVESGTHGLVPCGTTAEAATMSHAEHRRVIELAIEVAKGRSVIMPGTGSNSTAEAIELTRFAQKAGADAALVVVPYYNRPSQEGLYQHFKALHDATDLPIFVYNVPGRTGVSIGMETLARLSELPRIRGVKDATADLARPLLLKRLVKAPFWQFSGEDITAVPFLAQGGHGCISVTANVAPRELATMHEAWTAGDFATVSRINDQLAPLHDALFVESNPVPVKYALSLLGRFHPRMRLPLVELSDSSRRTVREAMQAAGLLDS